jgi:hypothetical protein
VTALFRKPKATPIPVPPDPRDDAARIAAEEARRANQKKGRASTVLTALMRAGPVQSGPVTTLTGGG